MRDAPDQTAGPERRRRIVFVNRYFAPDISATSQILSDLAFHLAAKEFEVHVVCGDSLYGADDSLSHEEVISGVHVHRTAGGQSRHNGLISRAATYLVLYWRLRARLSLLLRPGDVLVVKTDPPLLSILVAGLARQRGARLVCWLQDLYPEVAAALQVPLASGPVGRCLAFMRDRSLHSSSAVVVIGRRMADRIDAAVSENKVHIIPNWTDDVSVNPVPHAANPLREEWGLKGKFVIGYSGNLGRAHEFQTLLSAAHRLRAQDDLVFLFIGGGHHVSEMKRQVDLMGLQHLFQFRPYQRQDQLSFSLSAPDVHWLSLLPELEGLIVPSKFYGVAAVGRPIINVAAVDGEVAAMIDRFQCGLTVQPGDSEGLAEAFQRLKSRRSECEAMGMRGRSMVVDHFSRRRALDDWSALVEKLFV